MLVAYPLPDKGLRYPIRRGSGLFIYLLGVWRCLLGISKKTFHAFLLPYNRQLWNVDDTVE